MIKTMIVDDDAVVHVTLRSMTDWESCGYTVVKDCSGGAQALKYLEENSADLLITDIKMPEMSGLELMEQLRRKTSVPVTIVLSGYDEFDLVREAFRLGAYDYLLKSGINKESLTQMLNGLREKVFPNISVSDREYLHMEGLSTDTESDYIAAVFTVSEFSRAAQRFGGNLHERMEKPMLELVRQIRRLQDRAYIRARNPSCYELYYKVEDKNGVKETVLSVVHRIQSVWHDYMNLDTAAGIGYIASSQNTEQAVRCCDTLCKLSVLQGISGVCTHWEHGELAAEYENTAECCDGFITALFDEGSEYASRLDKESGHWFSALSRLNEKAHFRRILILLARLGERLKNYGLSFFEVFPEQTIFFITLKELEAPGEREIWLRSALRRVREACAVSRRNSQKGDMQKAKEFMQDNFNNPELTLKTVADYVGFNEKYFSSRFTKECGSTFISYLNDLRIKRAQELLLQTNMKMYEISEAVGYASVEHFNHMFKKKLCISPRDFRQSEK